MSNTPHDAETTLPSTRPLTPEETALVKGSAPVLAEHGTAITRRFYGQMLDAHPELKNLFNHSSQVQGHQAEALAGAVYAYAANIDNIAPLVPVVDRINQKHASLGITPDQYAVVGEYLLKAITDVLGVDVFKGALYDAWAAAYWQLAHIFIDREKVLYAQAGWVGWKPFVLQKRIKESDEISSFYLVPKEEGLPLSTYRPGQFISIRVFVKELGLYQCRHYSLSDAPSPDHFRISVKRERGVRATRETSSGDTHVTTADAGHPGWMSNLLHDTLEPGHELDVAFPFGDFVLEPGAGPVVLLSAGVGLTPLLAMLNALVAHGPDAASRRPVSWVQAARAPGALAFREHIARLAADHQEQLKTALFYSYPEGAPTGEHFVKGRLDLAKLDVSLLHLDDAATEYYVCGPEKFMLSMARELRERGVSASRIHAEIFGAGSLQL